MKYMTLREICNAADVSRRAVQGYEKAGLVSSSGKNTHGYLLYDADSLKRIKQIRFFQQLGFTIKEIRSIIDAPNHVLKSSLEEQVKKLENQKKKIEVLINETYKLIEKL